MMKHKKLNLQQFKKLYVEQRILDGKFEYLPKEIASEGVCKITCFGSLNNEGYEHGFLYLKEGAEVFRHKHTDNIELYKLVSGDEDVLVKSCMLGESHEINKVKCNTIIETFKLNKKIINKDFQVVELNEKLNVQAERYLWRINELVIKLAYDKGDMCYLDYNSLSFNYQIPVSSIENMERIYFYNRDIIPFDRLELTPDDVCIRLVPYRIDNFWGLKLDFCNPYSGDFSETANEIRNRQVKSLIKAKDIFSD